MSSCSNIESHVENQLLTPNPRYCASPFSGMGTTLALNGAYNLAGAILQHMSDHSLDYTSAFAQYEAKMRPLVDRAQKLPAGVPHLIHPETAWGVWILHALGFVVQCSGIGYLLAAFAGPPARATAVEEYGIGGRRVENVAKGEQWSLGVDSTDPVL